PSGRSVPPVVTLLGVLLAPAGGQHVDSFAHFGRQVLIPSPEPTSVAGVDEQEHRLCPQLPAQRLPQLSLRETRAGDVPEVQVVRGEVVTPVSADPVPAHADYCPIKLSWT